MLRYTHDKRGALDKNIHSELYPAHPLFLLALASALLALALPLERPPLLPRALLDLVRLPCKSCPALSAPAHTVAPLEDHERNEEGRDEREHGEGPACTGKP